MYSVWHRCAVVQTIQNIDTMINMIPLKYLQRWPSLDWIKGLLIVHRRKKKRSVILFCVSDYLLECVSMVPIAFTKTYVFGKSLNLCTKWIVMNLKNNLYAWLRNEMGRLFFKRVLSPFLKNNITALLVHVSSAVHSTMTKLKGLWRSSVVIPTSPGILLFLCCLRAI